MDQDLLEYYSRNPVIVSLSDLEEGKCDEMLPYAFGPESLGIILVNNLPDSFAGLRSKVLWSASQLAHLPDHVLEQLESPESFWLVGWSKGKEKLADDLFDERKGSFYANCAFYTDPNLDGPPAHETVKYEQYKGYTTPSIWPSKQDLPDFEKDFKELCGLMISTAVAVSKACDRLFGGKIAGYSHNHLEKIVSTSTTTKARLLHYFPGATAWCGEHLDHSSLTALTSAMYLDDSQYPRQAAELPNPPDAVSGLYVRNRRGTAVRVCIPHDCLAFQTGAALEETTGGAFKAVPHFVRGCSVEGVARNTLAVFCQPSLHEKVGPKYKDFAEFASMVIEKNH